MKPFLVCLPFAVLAAIRVASADPFTFDGLAITVPAGFEIERIAGPPLVDRPISAAFDERGRLYVTDSAGMSVGAEQQLHQKAHRLLRLEDSDGDGKFDRRTVFADGLAFPEGCLFYRGSIYVAAPPEIWKFTDADGDGVAEKREVWFDGKTLTHCGNDLHGPYLGRDGWFYWAKGAYAEQHYTLAGGRRFDTRAAHIFRARPDATGIEPVLTGGMDNPVGVAFSAAGERFLSGTFFENPAAGKRDGLIHSIYGGVYGKPRDTIYDHVMTGGLMPVLTQMGAAAPCGITCCRSDVAGDGFRDNLLVCYFNLHKVVRHELVPDGATFTTKDSDFVASDAPDFHPTDVIEDADGSFIILDTGGWYKICCPTSQLAKPDVLGAIYRVRRKGARGPDDPRGLAMAWEKLGPAKLTALLDDGRFCVRERAIDELAHPAADAIEPLSAVLVQSKSTIAKQNALWALCRIDSAAARAASRTALADQDISVAQVAMQAAASWRDGEALKPLVALLSHGNDVVVRTAAEALGRIGDRSAVPALLAAASRLASDGLAESGAPVADAARITEHSIIYALIEIGDAGATAKALESSNTRIRRAGLVALDQMKGGALKAESVTPLLNHSDGVLRLTAAWIVGHHPEWGDVLAGHFRQRLAGPLADSAERLGLEKQIAGLARSPAIQALLASAVAGGGEAGRLVALRAMASAGLNPAPAPWLDSIAGLLPQADVTILPEVVAAARALSLPKGGHAGFTQALVRTGAREEAPAQVRLDALSAAAGVGRVESPVFEFLLRSIMPGQQLLTRAAASAVLAKAQLTGAQQLALADAMKNVGPFESPKLLPAFERNATETLGLRLVSVLKGSPGLRGLRADLLAGLFTKYPPTVGEAGQSLIKLVNADVEKQVARLNDLVANLPAGDVRRGQAVFTRAGCLACHSIGYQGGRLGPDVTNIGKVRTPRDLLEALVYPSASIVRGYESFTVTTKTGETFVGTVAKDSAEEVVLNTGPQIQQRIARADVAGMNPVNVSLMPQGFGELLSKEELADLVAFLQASQR